MQELSNAVQQQSYQAMRTHKFLFRDYTDATRQSIRCDPIFLTSYMKGKLPTIVELPRVA